MQRDRNGDLWIGDEFGPWILHFDARRPPARGADPAARRADVAEQPVPDGAPAPSRTAGASRRWRCAGRPLPLRRSSRGRRWPRRRSTRTVGYVFEYDTQARATYTGRQSATTASIRRPAVRRRRRGAEPPRSWSSIERDGVKPGVHRRGLRGRPARRRRRRRQPRQAPGRRPRAPSPIPTSCRCRAIHRRRRRARRPVRGRLRVDRGAPGASTRRGCCSAATTTSRTPVATPARADDNELVTVRVPSALGRADPGQRHGEVVTAQATDEPVAVALRGGPAALGLQAGVERVEGHGQRGREVGRRTGRSARGSAGSPRASRRCRPRAASRGRRRRSRGRRCRAHPAVGSRPIGVSTASASPLTRSNTHFRTRLFSPKPGHRKRPSSSRRNQLTKKIFGRLAVSVRLADRQPVGEVVGEVVAAERQHRHRVEAQLADGALPGPPWSPTP